MVGDAADSFCSYSGGHIIQAAVVVDDDDDDEEIDVST